MIVQGIVLFMISFGMGMYATTKEVTNSPGREGGLSPDRWPPSNQVEMLKTCGIVCGKERIESYDAIRGECKCK